MKKCNFTVMSELEEAITNFLKNDVLEIKTKPTNVKKEIDELLKK